MTYQILTATLPSSLATLVNSALAAGWVLYGSLNVTPQGTSGATLSYSQAMTKVA